MSETSLEMKVIDWREEAEAIIQDIGFTLKCISISSVLPATQTEVFLNIETKEENKMCVELSSYGFRVVSDVFDEIREDFGDQIYYETPYALLDKYSSLFRESFAAALHRKLSDLVEST